VLPDIVSLTGKDLLELQAFLNACLLPSEDVETHINSFIGIKEGDRLIAVAGLEIDEPDALLRSVAVSPEFRGQGLAKLMVESLVKKTVLSRIKSLYLLTETAGLFFEKLGFGLIVRNDVPESIRSCRQFTGLCPDSAAVSFVKSARNQTW
jgi:amino-acid N-acetyltransferase